MYSLLLIGLSSFSVPTGMLKNIKALFILQGVSQPFKMDSVVCVSVHGFTAAAVLFYCLNW